MFFSLDAGWSIEVIGGAFAASGGSYVLSYGQVWLFLCVVYGEMPVDVDHSTVRCCPHSLQPPFLYLQSTSFTFAVWTYLLFYDAFPCCVWVK